MFRHCFLKFSKAEELLNENQKKILNLIKSKGLASNSLFNSEGKFIKSVESVTEIPPISSLSEVSFFGRSNVGKSTLLNSLLGGSKDLVKTSKKPGHTKFLNFFSLKNLILLVDLPGYGFAKKSRSTKKLWESLITEYIKMRSNLMMIYVLIDSRRNKLLQTDIEFIKDLKKSKSNFTILLTKIDQLKEKNEMNEIYKNIFSQLIKLNEQEGGEGENIKMEEYPLILSVSGKHKIGLDLLKYHISSSLSPDKKIELNFQTAREPKLIKKSTTNMKKNKREIEEKKQKIQKIELLNEIEKQKKFIFKSKLLDSSNKKERTKKQKKMYENIKSSKIKTHSK
eukprot:gene10384-2913_t